MPRINDEDVKEQISIYEAEGVLNEDLLALLDLRDERQRLAIAVEALEYVKQHGAPETPERDMDCWIRVCDALDRIKQIG